MGKDTPKPPKKKLWEKVKQSTKDALAGLGNAIGEAMFGGGR